MCSVFKSLAKLYCRDTKADTVKKIIKHNNVFVCVCVCVCVFVTYRGLTLSEVQMFIPPNARSKYLQRKKQYPINVK